MFVRRGICGFDCSEVSALWFPLSLGFPSPRRPLPQSRRPWTFALGPSAFRCTLPSRARKARTATQPLCWGRHFHSKCTRPSLCCCYCLFHKCFLSVGCRRWRWRWRTLPRNPALSPPGAYGCVEETVCTHETFGLCLHRSIRLWRDWESVAVCLAVSQTEPLNLSPQVMKTTHGSSTPGKEGDSFSKVPGEGVPSWLTPATK